MIGNANKIINWLLEQDRGKLFEIKEHKKKRSLNANNYAWALITEIANVQGISKDACYFNMLKDYGQSEMVSVISSIDVTGYFQYFEPCGYSKLQGKDFTHYKIYKGSSEYDSKEMAILIDGIIQEAKQLDIETMTADQIEQLKAAWRG